VRVPCSLRWAGCSSPRLPPDRRHSRRASSSLVAPVERVAGSSAERASVGLVPAEVVLVPAARVAGVPRRSRDASLASLPGRSVVASAAALAPGGCRRTLKGKQKPMEGKDSDIPAETRGQGLVFRTERRPRGRALCRHPLFRECDDGRGANGEGAVRAVMPGEAVREWRSSKGATCTGEGDSRTDPMRPTVW
jgi:hypothetical protein